LINAVGFLSSRFTLSNDVDHQLAPGIEMGQHHDGDAGGTADRNAEEEDEDILEMLLAG
jgi:hypothetical protein